jgi:oligosaccharide repeat unit polymerase
MKHKLFFFINLVILTILIVLFLLIPSGASEIVIWFCLGVFYVYFFSSIRKPLIICGKINTFIKIDTFFMLFYYIIYFYPYQLAVLGLKDLSTAVFLKKTYEEYSNVAVIMATIGLIAFQLGFKYYDSKKVEKVYYNISKTYMKVLTYLIFFLVIFILILFAKTGLKELFLGVYVGSKTGDVTYDAIFSLVSYFVVLGGIQVVTYFRLYRKLELLHYILLFVTVVWTIMLLILGDRNTFFIVAIVLAAGFFTYVRSISRKQIFILGFLALTIYQVVEVSRVAESRNLEAIWDAFVELNSTTNNQEQELEISSFNITTIGNRAGYKIIPYQEDFYYGKFKLVSLASIIPYSSRLFLNENDKTTGSSNVIKKEMIGEFATWGTGTNIITDAYMDFGVIGVIFFLYLFGRFGGFVKMKAQSNVNSPKWMFLYLITIGYYAEISRYGIDFPLRSLVWTILLFFIMNKVLNLKKLNNVY